jgi:hypothetical protein
MAVRVEHYINTLGAHKYRVRDVGTGQVIRDDFTHERTAFKWAEDMADEHGYDTSHWLYKRWNEGPRSD